MARSRWNWQGVPPTPSAARAALLESPSVFRTASSSTSTCVRPTAAPMTKSAVIIPRSIARTQILASRTLASRHRKSMRVTWTSSRESGPATASQPKGQKARLYVHGASQPCLIVNDLKLGDSSGCVALWIGPGTEGYFTGLEIKAATVGVVTNDASGTTHIPARIQELIVAQ